jgi:hypothetical protein
MRVATLYDLHGNLRALEAVLREIPDETTIVVGGDICAGGTHPSETLERLRALGERVLWLRGNADRELMPGEKGLAPAEVIEETRAALTAEQIAFLYGLPPTVQITTRFSAMRRRAMTSTSSRSGRRKSGSRISLPMSTPTSSSAVTRTPSSSARSRGSA